MRHATLALVITFTFFSPFAEAKRVKLQIGDAAPSWTNLVGTDGKKHSMEDFKSSEAMAIVFTCNECPVANAYIDRLSTLQKDYQKRGLRIVAINPSRGKPEGIEAMRTLAKKSSFQFLYLRDASQKVAKAYGALVTPEVFLFDRDRKLVYKGAIDDDRTLSGKAKNHYLRVAIEATLAGSPVKKNSTRAVGCAIRWK